MIYAKAGLLILSVGTMRSKTPTIRADACSVFFVSEQIGQQFGGRLEPLSIPAIMADAKIQYVALSYTMTHTPVSLIHALFTFCDSFCTPADQLIGIC